MKKEFFGIQKKNNEIVLFNLNGMGKLSKGDIFFRINEDKTMDVLPEYEHLDKEYVKNIINELSEDDKYDLKILKSK